MIRSTAEFARHVGLARTTVSRVLNGQPGLKAKTIERVQRALAETGFTPNAHAVHLKGKRTSMIGICMEDLATPPAVRKLAVLQRVLRMRGFSSLIEVFTPGAGRDVVRHFQSLRVEAVVFIGHFHREEMEARIAELTAAGTPHVVIDHYGLKGANTVTLDRAAGMEAVVAHLYDLGHRRFGLLGVTKGPTSRIDRLTGIHTALRDRRLDFDACVVSLDHLHERRNDFDYGRALAGSFVRHPGRPTAFLGYNDEIAIGALRGFQEAGLKVPRDVSLTGFNNQDICHMTWPTLTTVDQNIDTTVEEAAEVLISQLGKPLRPRPVVRTIAPLLVVGESTAEAKKAEGLKAER
ncbi:LacI family DNA-binding transcriptional regulator [Opitutus sp. ER46]|uniref:LacI family DNA-binding transcriptional regulator n=1 Tax=Opitutus sp. ER46 TaxID=2161864 RepID=UPI001304B4A2|nr:LacI family DNA-binding transcriptional regulator [Opitutus sp. ER46]